MFFQKKKKEAAGAPDLSDGRLRHIAFIMDGNGRWAKKRGMPREYGHKRGAENFRRIGRYCESIGLQYMTVYAFSTENWKRPEHEVKALLGLLDDYIEEFFREIDKEKIHLCFVGNLSAFPDGLREKMERLDRETADRAFRLDIAVNYGGREEIAHACEALIREGKQTVTEDDISAHLYTAGCPDPDLIVRTGGDLRSSNFLLWQSAYAEYYFTDTLWPDYRERDVDEAIRSFLGRKRRFGGVKNI